MKRLNI